MTEPHGSLFNTTFGRTILAASTHIYTIDSHTDSPMLRLEIEDDFPVDENAYGDPKQAKMTV